MGEYAFGVGLDIGSTTAKGVLIDKTQKILAHHIQSTGASAASAGKQVLATLTNISGVPVSDCRIVGTGYGRAMIDGTSENITEITCHSVGVNSLNPNIRLLVDVGGQDSKVIRIGPMGRPTDFELNDKCSAGTGRFLEVMARVFEVSIEELGPLALESTSPSTISSTCTVFAESEVIGRIGSGDSPADIAAGVHIAMASKIGTLAKRVGIVKPVGLTGGVALNPAFRQYLAEKLGAEIWLPEKPQLTGAFGAAILALH